MGSAFASCALLPDYSSFGSSNLILSVCLSPLSLLSSSLSAPSTPVPPPSQALAPVAPLLGGPAGGALAVANAGAEGPLEAQGGAAQAGAVDPMAPSFVVPPTPSAAFSAPCRAEFTVQALGLHQHDSISISLVSGPPGSSISTPITSNPGSTIFSWAPPAQELAAGAQTGDACFQARDRTGLTRSKCLQVIVTGGAGCLAQQQHALPQQPQQPQQQMVQQQPQQPPPQAQPQQPQQPQQQQQARAGVPLTLQPRTGAQQEQQMPPPQPQPRQQMAAQYPQQPQQYPQQPQVLT